MDLLSICNIDLKQFRDWKTDLVLCHIIIMIKYTFSQSLDADYSKNQESLLGVLCHMMSGKSFELILAAAAATGKLQSFAVKLVRYYNSTSHFTELCCQSAQVLHHTLQSFAVKLVRYYITLYSQNMCSWELVVTSGIYLYKDLLKPDNLIIVPALIWDIQYNSIIAACNFCKQKFLQTCCMFQHKKSFHLLFRFNEFAKQSSNEASKAASTRAMIFDISFLMLCHITQLYGIEVWSMGFLW